MKCLHLTSSSFFAFPVTKTTDVPAHTAMTGDTRRTNTNGPDASGSATANQRPNNSTELLDQSTCNSQLQLYNIIQSARGATSEAVRLKT